MRVLDVVEWWEIPTVGDTEVDLTQPGCRFVHEWVKAAPVKQVEMRPNTDLDDFFARPMTPTVKVVEGNMRRNDLLDAFFGI